MRPTDIPETNTVVELHGLTLAFYAPDAPLRERFRVVYGHLPQPASPETGISIGWQLHDQRLAPAPPATARPIVTGDLVSYYESGELVLLRMPKYGLIEIDRHNNRID